MFILSLLTVLACSPAVDDTGVAVQALDMPADPAVQGVPVGVRTIVDGKLTVEIWYPADDAVAGQAGDTVDTTTLVPVSVQDHLGGVTLPGLSTFAVRDAAPRPMAAAVPVLLFSHGFGAFRQQSVDLTSHLASRGYVVVSADHPGRMLGDVLPCLFSPPLDGCDLSGFTEDPAPDDLEDALELVTALSGDDWLSGVADPSTVAVLGHSAGAGSATSVAQDWDGVVAVVPMSGGGAVTQAVPALYMSGSCDPFPGLPTVTTSAQGAADARLVGIVGAGHLAFSDVCELELGALAEELLASRDDLNTVYYDALVQLATDGCPGATPDPSLETCDSFLDLDVSDPIIRHYVTVFLDQQLKSQGDGVQVGEFSVADVELAP